MKRYAIVTPYFQEDRSVLERCIGSVRSQAVRADHILIADGFPQSWIDGEQVRHLILDRNHGDYGSTPRALGLLLATAERYDGIGLLDADNWMDSDHIVHCMETARAMPGGICDYIVARRRFIRADGSVMSRADEPIDMHVDTNCLFLLPGSYHTVSVWGMIPKELAIISDRIFHSSIRARALIFSVNRDITVNYYCMWKGVYEEMGELPPEGAKPNIDMRPVNAWLMQRSARDLEILHRRTGVKFHRSQR